jgi:uncharacterized damage-inducible protein DinB
MVTRIKWFERQFDFQYPIGIFPSILERVRGTPARLEELVHSFPQLILTPRINASWSIQEHVGHLFDLEELHFGRLEDYDANAQTLRPADLKNQQTMDANHNAKPIGLLLTMFRASRGEFVKRLESMDNAQVARSAIHPRLKKSMRVIDMAFFVAEHDDHHMASMTEIAQRLKRQ